MAFEGLSEKLQGAFKDLKGQGVVTEKDFDNAMRVVKMALLEADVNFKVVKDFVATQGKGSRSRSAQQSDTRPDGSQDR